MTRHHHPDLAGERGATIFVVLLVLTLLSAVGIFSVRAATQVTIAAGNSRQATQSLLFAEGAGALAIAELGGPKATLYVDLMRTSSDALNEQCQVNATLTRNKAVIADYVPPHCYRLFSNEVAAHVVAAAGSDALLYELQTADAPGSFGPALGANDDQLTGGTAVNAGHEGQFMVELTDGYKGPSPAGFNVDDSAYQSVLVTLNVFSQVRNRPNAAHSAQWCGTEASAATASLQAVRATVTLPMVMK